MDDKRPDAIGSLVNSRSICRPRGCWPVFPSTLTGDSIVRTIRPGNDISCALNARRGFHLADHNVWIGPSIITADLLNLGTQIEEAEEAGVNFIHLDVMDGRFVPNITFGLPVAEALRTATSLPLDVHLMIVEPERYVQRFVEAGANTVTIHVESCTHLHGALRMIAEAGATPAVTLNPATSLTTVEEVLPIVGQVLVMSVNPGFGGQAFIPSSLEKIARLRRMIEERNPSCRLQVDGGIKATNIRQVVDAGADTIVAGSAIYASEASVSEAVRALREALDS